MEALGRNVGTEYTRQRKKRSLSPKNVASLKKDQQIQIFSVSQDYGAMGLFFKCHSRRFSSSSLELKKTFLRMETLPNILMTDATSRYYIVAHADWTRYK